MGRVGPACRRLVRYYRNPVFRAFFHALPENRLVRDTHVSEFYFTSRVNLGALMNAALAAGKLRLIVGYDGSAPAVRALDAAVGLLRGRDGSIDVVYVAHLTSLEMMSADATAEMRGTFDQIAADLQAQAERQLAGREGRWRFEHRQGMISEQLAAAAAQSQEPSGPASW